MKYNTLGRTDVKVSDLCLGSMTWGTGTPEAEGHDQIDMALDHGINFIDSAEMYPVLPTSKETQGDSERVLGTWLKKTGRRDDVVIATKVSGAGFPYIRNGSVPTGKAVKEAVEGNLERLQTDYIDVYQLHWPARKHYHFRNYWNFQPETQPREETKEHMLDILSAMTDLIKEGKIRACGLSNETAWGVGQWARIAEENNLPHMATIQNEYSLLCRIYDMDLAEASHQEQIDLICYSPLATGLLTGKYDGGKIPEGSRASISGDLNGRLTEHALAATTAYQQVADKHGLSLVQLSLAFCTSRPFMGSVIFGARAPGQLEEILKAKDVVLSDEALTDINAVHRDHPMPF